MSDTTKRCGGKTCTRPCRGAQDCMLRNVPRHEQRVHYVKKIEDMLQHGPLSREQIVMTLDLNYNTGSNYLRHMHRDLRTIRRIEVREGGSVKVLWELGEDPTLPAGEDAATTQHTVPARQMGMVRDPFALPVTFFRSLQGAAAC